MAIFIPPRPKIALPNLRVARSSLQARNLAAFYPLNNAGSSRDKISPTRNAKLVPVGSVGTSFWPYGGARSVNGSAYLTCANLNGAVGYTANFSVSAWAKLNSGVTGTIISSDYAGQYINIIAWTASNTLKFSVIVITYDGEGNPIETEYSRTDVVSGYASWHHVAMAYSGGVASCYFNGKLLGQITDITPDNGIYSFVLGQSLTGFLADVRVYSRAFLAREVADLYRNPLAVYERPAAIYVSAASAGSVTGTGSVAGITISAPNGTATGSSTATATGDLASITISAPNGTATSDATASGSVASVTVSAPEGTASGVASATGTGDVAGITVTAPEASATTDSTATGAVAGVTITAPTGVANPPAGVQLTWSIVSGLESRDWIKITRPQFTEYGGTGGFVEASTSSNTYYTTNNGIDVEVTDPTSFVDWATFLANATFNNIPADIKLYSDFVRFTIALDNTWGAYYPRYHDVDNVDLFPAGVAGISAAIGNTTWSYGGLDGVATPGDYNYLVVGSDSVLYRVRTTSAVAPTNASRPYPFMANASWGVAVTAIRSNNAPFIRNGTALQPASNTFNSTNKPLISAVLGGKLQVSSGNGGTWTDLPGSINGGWLDAAISNNLQLIVALNADGNIYVSANYGVTFAIQTAPGNRSWSKIRGWGIGSWIDPLYPVQDGATFHAIHSGTGNVWRGMYTAAAASVTATGPIADIKVGFVPSATGMGSIAPITVTSTGQANAGMEATALAAPAPITVEMAEAAFDLKPKVITQYQSSPKLLRIIKNWTEAFDQQLIFTRFYNQIWNIDTANSYGLDIWGRIVGVSRFLQFDPGEYFGFDPDFEPFGQAPFSTGAAATNTYRLSDDLFRRVIYAKALANITDTSIPTLNRVLSILFEGRGLCYATDLGDMQISFSFDFELTDIDNAILANKIIIPRPAGVGLSIVEL